jgi:hypothetical protein
MDPMQIPLFGMKGPNHRCVGQLVDEPKMKTTYGVRLSSESGL